MKTKNRINLFYQKSWFVYLFIGFLVFFVWHKVLNQMFLGEGYQYFNPLLYLLPIKSLTSLGGYDNFAKIFIQILSPIFRENLKYYFQTELAIAILSFGSFYFVLSKITKDKIIALTATIFFSTNYVALFEFLGAGNYQRFIQRFPVLIPIIFSFYFLWKFINQNKYKDLLVSLSLYSLAILIGHFSILSISLFIIYPFVQLFDEKPTLKLFTKRVFVVASFIALAVLLTKNGDQKPAYDLLSFFFREKNILERVLYQIPIITVPINLIPFIAKHLPVASPEPYTTLLKIFLAICLVFYISGGYFVIKRLPKMKILYLTLFVSMISSMFLYLYVDVRLDPTIGFGENRYYLFSSMMAVIMWALIIKATFIKKVKLYIIISIVILSAFVYSNTANIWRHIDKIQYQSEMFKNFITYIKENSYKYIKDSVIVTPYYLNWCTPLITEFINKNVTISLTPDGWEKKYWNKREKVFVYDYYYSKSPSGEPDISSGKVVDLTDEYRRGEKNVFLH